MKLQARFASAILLGLVLSLSVSAQEIPLVIKGKTLTVVQEMPFTISAPDGYHFYYWSIPSGVEANRKFGTLEITKAPKGAMKVSIEAVKIDFKAEKVSVFNGSVTFAVGDVPPGPVPPGPTPPDPPVPPTPPTPIPFPGFRVMIVYESAELAKLPPAQLAALHAQTIKSYLNAKCVTDEEGKQKAWRLWDKDVDTTNASKWAKEALARAVGKSLPWAIISNGTTGFEGPIPANTTEFMALLQKYGG